VVCHALYLINLASPKKDFYEKSVAALQNTVEVAVGIGAEGVIFHTGSHQGAGFDKALERVVPACGYASSAARTETWLLIENTAGTGDTIGRSLDELAAIVDRLDRHPRLGVCLDSCHLYASGYDVTDQSALDGVIEEVDAKIGLDRLRALHVNDSKTPLGSNRDRHDNVGEGLMGDKLGVFLSHPALQGHPCSARGAGHRRTRSGQEAGAEAEAAAHEMDEEMSALVALVAAALLAVPAKKVPHFVKKVDVGGYKLAIECYGRGSPVVVLDSGFSTPRSAWYWVVPRLRTTTRVCSYDRAGLGQSERRPAAITPTTDVIMGELHTLLQRAKLAPPYVLGGWSIGGFDVRYYQHRYPAEGRGSRPGRRNGSLFSTRFPGPARFRHRDDVHA
jgi:deoxyribonuclease-4